MELPTGSFFPFPFPYVLLSLSLKSNQRKQIKSKKTNSEILIKNLFSFTFRHSNCTKRIMCRSYKTTKGIKLHKFAAYYDYATGRLISCNLNILLIFNEIKL